jgi:hypothetical protein
MTKKRRRAHAPRVFDGWIIMSDEIGRIKGLLGVGSIEAVSDSLRELNEDLAAGMTKCRPRPPTRPRS